MGKRSDELKREFDELMPKRTFLLDELTKVNNMLLQLQGAYQEALRNEGEGLPGVETPVVSEKK